MKNLLPTNSQSPLVRRCGRAALALVFIWLAAGEFRGAARAQTATWAGGNTFKGVGAATNWNPAGVPLGPTYTVLVPDSASLVYDISSNNVIDGLSFGSGSVFRFTNGTGLTVNGPALIKGQIEALGAGSAFRAPANVTVLQTNPRLLATNGGQILVGASTYIWDYYNASATLLSAVGANSLVDLKSVSSMSVSYGDNGAWTYTVNARSNGVVDLSGVVQLTGPTQDDWLEFNLDNGGSVKFDSLRRLANRTRFNVNVPLLEFPLLENASVANFNLGTNTTVRFPSLLTYDSATLNLAQGATLQAAKLGSASSSTINVGAGGLVNAPSLASLDTVPLNLTSDGAFVATNLAVYRNSDIPILPGRNFQAGLLTDVYGSRVSVKGGSIFRLGAVAYDCPGDWRGSPTIFSAEGDGSLLDLSAMKSLRVNGGNGGAWYYSVTANTNAVVDLSGLQTAIGADPSAYDNDDWLNFNILNGGNIRLDSLRQATRRVRFNLGVPRYDLPSLQLADNTLFILPDGARLNVTNLNSLDTCSFSFGFNSTFNAPNLLNLVNLDLNLGVGKILIAPPLTNIYASRLSVSGGSVLHVAAPSYEVPPDWRWSPTLFLADGAGSLLEMAAIRTLKVYGGHYNSWVYSVTANNNGVIDLSGLDTAIGADPGNWAGDDWLEFNIRNGGSMLLDSLRQITRRTRFNIEVSEFTLPSLALANTTTFTLANGTKLNLPNVSRLENCAFNYGPNSILNAPNLLNVVNADFSVGPGRTVIVPAFTNIDGARLSVTGGSNLAVAATSYQAPGDWRSSPTLLLADGAGSLLNLAAMKTFRASGGDGGAWVYGITARNNGVIDLSGLQTMTGADQTIWGGDDWLTLNVQTGGTIRLDSLQQLNPAVQVNIGDNASLSAPNLSAMTGSSITLGFNSTLTAPALLNFVHSTVSVSPGKNLNTPPFTNVYASRLAVSGGSSLHVAALGYDAPSDWRWSPTLFSADGAGSLMDLSAMKTFRVQGGHYGAWYSYVNANNAGVIDLSGLDTIIGADPSNWGGEDWLSYNATGGGLIKFGNASVTRRTQFTGSGSGSTLQFASLYLRPPSTLNVNSRAVLDVKGNYAFENTDPNSIPVSGIVQMDGTQPQTLEAGGKDLGPTGASSLNFGFSQLIVGNSNQTSIVHLQDLINNGQRGAGGQPETLYLYGLDGQGLRLLNNSRLILNNIPVYALMGGQMRLLNSLVSPAANSLAFDGGFIANTAGPRITNMVPAVTVMPPISAVDVTFDIPIQASTFTTADLVISGPGGPIAATGVAPVAGNTYRITFPLQTVNGVYTVRVGPNIDELAQNLSGMDQDGDGAGGEPEDVFQGTFAIDGLPPVVLSAVALQSGNRVGVTFDEVVDAIWATNAANYLVNGVNPSQAVLQPNGAQVVLSVSPLPGDSFTLDVNGLKDLMGNTANRSLTGAILSLKAVDVGNPGTDPRERGTAVTFDGVGFDLVAGGSGFWTPSDSGFLVQELRSGDFDVAVCLASQTRPGSWTQSGLMARESLAANSRGVFANVEYGSSYNRYAGSYRAATGGPSAYWADLSAAPNVPLPNAWLRLRREGPAFTFFRGTNGVDWTPLCQVTNAMSASLYVGLAAASVNNAAGQTTAVSFRNYSDLSPGIVSQPQGQTVASGSNIVFGVTARGTPVLSYQWFFNGQPIDNATGSLLTLNAVTTANVGDYLVVVTNTYGAATSQVAMLVVDGVGGGGFEADVMPTPYGNNVVTVSDWTRIGRLVAGLDTVLSSSEFQRADCAPRTNATLGTLPLGDGRLSVADWAQAGRYAAGLDPLTPAGGTNQALSGGLFSPQLLTASLDPALRQLRVLDTTASPGQTFDVDVQLQGAGDENAVGFSLSFDPAKLIYRSTALAEAGADASVQVNTRNAAAGRLGIVLAKAAGQSFGPGSNVILRLRFTAVGDPGAASLLLGDVPVLREVASVTAEARRAQYQGAAITVVRAARLALAARPAGGRVRLSMGGQPGQIYRLEVSTDLVHWELLTLQAAGVDPATVDDPAPGPGAQRFYRAVPQP